LYSKYGQERFEILAISLDMDKATWLQSLKKHRNPWIQVWGSGEFENELFQEFRGGGIPFYVLIDAEGRIVRYNDVRPSFNLEETLDEIFGGEFLTKPVTANKR
jgi:hypothetical protein